MVEAEVHTVAMDAPEDVSGVADLFHRGLVDPAHVVAIIAQTEGDGHARGYCALCLRRLFAAKLGLTEAEIFDRIPMLMIGGTAGLMSPHFTILVNKPSVHTGKPGERRLVIGVASTRPLAAEEYGTLAQLRLVTQAVTEAMKTAGIPSGEDVVCVELKCPQMTRRMLSDAMAAGVRLATSDLRHSSQLCRGAAALGAAVALGEIASDAVDDSAIGGRPDLFSTKASASSGNEQVSVRVVVLGSVANAPGSFVAGGGVMAHQLDVVGAQAAFVAAGLRLESGTVIPDDRSRFCTAFVNAGADSLPHILGHRHTMHTDLMTQFTGHVGKAIAHAAVAGIAQNPMVLGNAGSEHQGAPGSNLVCVIARAA